jgi:hypothetical protein
LVRLALAQKPIVSSFCTAFTSRQQHETLMTCAKMHAKRQSRSPIFMQLNTTDPALRPGVQNHLVNDLRLRCKPPDAVP